MMSIKDVCAKFGLSAVYVRRAYLGEKLAGTKVPVPGMTNTFKVMFDEAEVDRWRKESGTHRRTDGRSRFVTYGTIQEIEDLKSLVKDREIGVIITRQNKVKKVS